ncbi:hypothetical protein HanIR_Chr04g0168691 [Helianthus annuus]|nr:hypothetical protein HanIR_Chr04g0168691 [Helianthus annuus]
MYGVRRCLPSSPSVVPATVNVFLVFYVWISKNGNEKGNFVNILSKKVNIRVKW